MSWFTNNKKNPVKSAWSQRGWAICDGCSKPIRTSVYKANYHKRCAKQTGVKW